MSTKATPNGYEQAAQECDMIAEILAEQGMTKSAEEWRKSAEDFRAKAGEG